MIVLDASAVVDLLARREHEEWVAARLGEAAPNVAAPHLVDVEVLSAIRGLMLGGHLRRGDARAALEDLEALPLARYPLFPLVDRAWQLQDRISPYDAMYVTLAEALDATLVTTDRALERTVRRLVRVLTPTYEIHP